jgi:hypothetical protein
VDGGLINNEPFEIARRYLANGVQPNERDADKARKAMILVDPFPNHAELPKEPAPDDVRLTSVIPGFFGTLVDQARFKPEELALARSDRVFSRFAIVPSRPSTTDEGRRYPIACGILGGFGGFLHQSFRRHDYLLGRRNAQAFLRWSFMLAETNPLFADFVRRGGPALDKWYVRQAPQMSGSVAPAADLHAPKADVRKTVSGNETERALPIIPLTPRMQTPIEIPSQDLPDPHAVDLERLERRLNDRLSAVIGTFLRQDLPKVVKLGLWATPASYLVQPHLVHIAKEMALQKVGQGLAELGQAFPPSR